MLHRLLVVVAAAVVLAGCSARRPVLYPNEQLQTAGQAGADQAIAECEQFAAQYVDRDSGKATKTAKDAAIGGGIGAASGAVGGAIWGNPGVGAASGAAAGVTAGLLGSFFSSGGPSSTYQNFVNNCLHDKGYRVVGWQ